MVSSVGLLTRVLLLQTLLMSASLGSVTALDEEAFYLTNQVSGERMMSHVIALASFGTRYVGTEGANMSAEFLHRYFTSMGLDAAFHPFVPGDGLSGRNVVATKNGAGSCDEYVLLFAHYDSISDAPTLSAPGANDNACGVAVMMEAALIMSGGSWNRTVMFIAFSGEEVGFIGSSAWVNENSRILGRIVGAICVDGVGRGRGISILFSDEASEDLANLVYDASIALGFASFKAVAGSSGVRGSDSGAFLGRGLRVVRLWDWDTAFIHSSADTPDTLSPVRLVETAKVTLATLYALATKPLEAILPERQTPQLDRGALGLTVLLPTIGLVSAVLLFLVLRHSKGGRFERRSLRRDAAAGHLRS